MGGVSHEGAALVNTLVFLIKGIEATILVTCSSICTLLPLCLPQCNDRARMPSPRRTASPVLLLDFGLPGLQNCRRAHLLFFKLPGLDTLLQRPTEDWDTRTASKCRVSGRLWPKLVTVTLLVLTIYSGSSFYYYYCYYRKIETEYIPIGRFTPLSVRIAGVEQGLKLELGT